MAGASSGGATGSSIKAGACFVEVFAKTGGLIGGIDKGLKQAEKMFISFGARIAKAGAFSAAVGGAILAPLGLMSAQFVEAGSQATDMAERLNTSTETITALGYAAGLAGGTLEDVEANLGKMQKTIAESAANGDEFFGGLLGKNVDQQLAAIADLIGGITDPTLQSAAAMEVFGKSGRKMLPFLKDGAEGIAKLKEAAGKHGAIISADDAARADRIGDAFSNISTVVKSITREVGSAMLPDAGKFEGYAEMVAGAGATVRGFVKDNAEVIQTVGKVGLALSAAGAGLAGLGGALGLTGAALGSISSVLSFVFSPQGMIITGGAIIVGTLTAMSAEAGHLSTVVGTMAETFSLAFNGITAALKAGDIRGAGKVLVDSLRSSGEQILLFFEKIWNELRMQGKMLGNEIGFAIATGIRGALAALPAGIRATLGVSDDYLKKVKDAHELRRKVENRDAQMMRDGDNSDVDQRMKKVNDQLRRDAERESLPVRQPGGFYGQDNNAGADDGFAKPGEKFAELGAQAERLNKTFVGMENAGEILLNAQETAASQIKGAFASSFDARTFTFADKNEKAVSILQKILIQDQQANEALQEIARNGGGLAFGA